MIDDWYKLAERAVEALEALARAAERAHPPMKREVVRCTCPAPMLGGHESSCPLAKEGG